MPRRVSQMQQMDPEKQARLAMFLASDAARDVTGQIFVFAFGAGLPEAILVPKASRGLRRPPDATTARRHRAVRDTIDVQEREQ